MTILERSERRHRKGGLAGGEAWALRIMIVIVEKERSRKQGVIRLEKSL